MPRRARLVPLAALLLLAPAAGRPAAAAPGEPATAAPADRWDAAELETLVAPVALYPDPLLAAMLPATTDPLALVRLARWVAAQPGPVAELPPDAGIPETVAAMVQFPDVLAWMNDNLEWVEAVGDAVATQQDDVLKAVQAFRAKAKAAGTLASGPELVVTTTVAPTTRTEVIVIDCTTPDVVYVPVYDPVVVVTPRPPTAAPALTFAAGVALGVAGAWLWHELVWDDVHIGYHPGGPHFHRNDLDVDIDVGDVNIGNDVRVGGGVDVRTREVNRPVRWAPTTRPAGRRPGRAGSPPPSPLPYRPPTTGPRRPAAPGGVRPPGPSTMPARGGPGARDLDGLGRPTTTPAPPAFDDGRGPATRDASRRGRGSLGGLAAGPTPPPSPGPGPAPGPGPQPAPAPSPAPFPTRDPAGPGSPPRRADGPGGGAFGGVGSPGARRAADRGRRSLPPELPKR